MNLVANWYKLNYRVINIVGQLCLMSSLKVSHCTEVNLFTWTHKDAFLSRSRASEQSPTDTLAAVLAWALPQSRGDGSPTHSTCEIKQGCKDGRATLSCRPTVNFLVSLSNAFICAVLHCVVASHRIQASCSLYFCPGSIMRETSELLRQLEQWGGMTGACIKALRSWSPIKIKIKRSWRLLSVFCWL